MSIWILALVLLASVGALGFRQGVIRTGISFVGIIIAAFLASPLSGIFKPVLPWFGVKNPVLLWVIAPFVAFWVVNALFKYAAYHVHRTVDVHYRHKVSELELSLWLRLSSRLGLCLGLFNGAVYFILISFLIFNLSYWTSQVAASAGQPAAVRLVNQLGADLQATGFARTAAAVAKLPDNYYDYADLAGFLIQNPQVEPRLENYPGLTSLIRRPEMQPFFTDGDFTNQVATGGSAVAIWNSGPIQQFFANQDLMHTVTGVIQTNFSDLTNYLQTGQSPKFDAEKLLGTWKVNIPVTLAWLRQDRPKITAKEMRSLRAWYNNAYANTTLLATGDGDVFVSGFPEVQKSQNPAQPPTIQMVDIQGRWDKGDNGYDLQWKLNDQDKFYTGVADNARLTLKDGRVQIIFDRQ